MVSTIKEQNPSAELANPIPPGIAKLEEALEVHAGSVPDPNRRKSGGEVMFDRVVYTGIGFGVNEASSLWITDQFMHGKPKSWLGGKPFSKDGFEAATKWIAKTFNMSHGKAGNSLLMATLLSGGTLLVLPMRALEENKIYWAEKCNHFLDAIKGSKLTPEERAARDEEVKNAIACSPQQSWKTLLIGRGAAMFSSWATGTFLIKPEGNKKIMDFSEKHLTTAAKAVGMEQTTKTDIFKRYARLIGVETYSCALSSAVLEITSKFFARRGTEIHDPDICAAAHAKPQAPAAPTSTSSDTSGGGKLNPEQFRKTPVSATIPSSTYGEQAKQAKADKEKAPAALGA